ncbi:MAG TPA: dUTP diphosphatase [Fimbriimonadaceae bacterium]|nr:dUTP diphosphatase [Fimbriimonadaceae bacterium]HRJ33292.1 dUTP diphosphatase [Fimbriimonadaceae bacterium]
MTPHRIAIPITTTDNALPPEYATPGAAGMDVRSIEDVTLHPGERKAVRTGLSVAIPPGFELQARPRSGLALRHGLGLVNSPGTIDSDFRGEIRIILINWGSEIVELKSGERIAQLVLCPVVHCDWVLVQDLDSTERNQGGFGSTGTQ